MDTNDNQPLDQPRFAQEPSPDGDAPPDKRIGETLESWLQKMCSNMERMANDEEYRRLIAKRLF